MKVKSLSRVQLLATPWTAAYQAPPSMGFSRQEYWSGVPLPSLLPPIGTAFLCNISVSSTFHAHRHCVCLLSAPVLELLDTHSPLNTTRLPPGHQQGSDCGASHTLLLSRPIYSPDHSQTSLYGCTNTSEGLEKLQRIQRENVNLYRIESRLSV